MISFNVKNAGLENIIVVHEPECYEFALPPNESISIFIEPIEDSVNLHLSIFESKIDLAILDNMGRYKVMYKGDDAFDKFFL